MNFTGGTEEDGLSASACGAIMVWMDEWGRGDGFRVAQWMRCAGLFVCLSVNGKYCDWIVCRMTLVSGRVLAGEERE